MRKKIDVKVEQPANKVPPSEFDKFEIPSEMDILASDCLDAIRPTLKEGELYTTQDLCGDELWVTLCPIKKRQIFLALKRLCCFAIVPLELVYPKEPGPLYFRLT